MKRLFFTVSFLLICLFSVNTSFATHGYRIECKLPKICKAEGGVIGESCGSQSEEVKCKIKDSSLLQCHPNKPPFKSCTFPSWRGGGDDGSTCNEGEICKQFVGNKPGSSRMVCVDKNYQAKKCPHPGECVVDHRCSRGKIIKWNRCEEETPNCPVRPIPVPQCGKRRANCQEVLGPSYPKKIFEYDSCRINSPEKLKKFALTVPQCKKISTKSAFGLFSESSNSEDENPCIDF